MNSSQTVFVLRHSLHMIMYFRPLHLYTGQFKKKVTLSHVYNEVTSEPTITRYTTIVKKTVKVLQHVLPWRRRPETLSRVNYK
jgi:hypothetical protein